MEKNIAIQVNNVGKTFRIPHEKITTIRGAFVSALKSHGYEEFKALEDVSFEVKKGEFFGIIGRNGSGKSTLLKILAGIYQTDKGKVKVNGLISPFLELGIGFNPELSGRDNVYLNATVLGMTHKQIEEKFDDIVEFSELRRFIDQKIKNYSSGMQVRLAFSVAIYANRDILLMDEVLAVGDTNFQRKCLEQFIEYKKSNKTILFVSHDLATVQRFCDRVMLLRNGEIQFVGNPEEAVNRYVSQSAADEEKTKSAESAGSSLARITKVEFLDGEKRKKHSFSTGEAIVIRIRYKTKEKIEEPMIGLAIFNQDGIQISGPNSISSGLKLDHIDGEGHVDYVILQNPFFSGVYYLTVAIHDKYGAVSYDFKEKAYAFNVISKEKNQYGILKLDHRWEKSQ